MLCEDVLSFFFLPSLEEREEQETVAQKGADVASQGHAMLTLCQRVQGVGAPAEVREAPRSIPEGLSILEQLTFLGFDLRPAEWASRRSLTLEDAVNLLSGQARKSAGSYIYICVHIKYLSI